MFKTTKKPIFKAFVLVLGLFQFESRAVPGMDQMTPQAIRNLVECGGLNELLPTSIIEKLVSETTCSNYKPEEVLNFCQCHDELYKDSLASHPQQANFRERLSEFERKKLFNDASFFNEREVLEKVAIANSIAKSFNISPLPFQEGGGCDQSYQKTARYSPRQEINYADFRKKTSQSFANIPESEYTKEILNLLDKGSIPQDFTDLGRERRSPTVMGKAIAEEYIDISISPEDAINNLCNDVATEYIYFVKQQDALEKDGTNILTDLVFSEKSFYLDNELAAFRGLAQEFLENESKDANLDKVLLDDLFCSKLAKQSLHTPYGPTLSKERLKADVRKAYEGVLFHQDEFQALTTSAQDATQQTEISINSARMALFGFGLSTPESTAYFDELIDRSSPSSEKELITLFNLDESEIDAHAEKMYLDLFAGTAAKRKNEIVRTLRQMIKKTRQNLKDEDAIKVDREVNRRLLVEQLALYDRKANTLLSRYAEDDDVQNFLANEANITENRKFLYSSLDFMKSRPSTTNPENLAGHVVATAVSGTSQAMTGLLANASINNDHLPPKISDLHLGLNPWAGEVSKEGKGEGGKRNTNYDARESYEEMREEVTNDTKDSPMFITQEVADFTRSSNRSPKRKFSPLPGVRPQMRPSDTVAVLPRAKPSKEVSARREVAQEGTPSQTLTEAPIEEKTMPKTTEKQGIAQQTMNQAANMIGNQMITSKAAPMRAFNTRSPASISNTQTQKDLNRNPGQAINSTPDGIINNGEMASQVRPSSDNEVSQLRDQVESLKSQLSSLSDPKTDRSLSNATPDTDSLVATAPPQPQATAPAAPIATLAPNVLGTNTRGSSFAAPAAIPTAAIAQVPTNANATISSAPTPSQGTNTQAPASYSSPGATRDIASIRSSAKISSSLASTLQSGEALTLISSDIGYAVVEQKAANTPVKVVNQDFLGLTSIEKESLVRELFAENNSEEVIYLQQKDGQIIVIEKSEQLKIAQETQAIEQQQERTTRGLRFRLHQLNAILDKN